MNSRDALSENDLYPAWLDDDKPTWYCDYCHLELSYPAESGMHIQCELKHEDEQFAAASLDPRRI